MRYRKLDLNLLVALDALLTTSSVSRAAKSLHVTQPAMSASLARLREYFEDELLVPAGRRLVLTPMATALAEPTRSTMESIDETLSRRPSFEPFTARRTFVVAASDYSAQIILQPVVALMAKEAPGISLEIISASPELTNEQLKRREIDFSLMPDNVLLPDHPCEVVLKEEFCCVVWRGNQQLKTGTLSLQQLRDAAHVVTRYGIERRSGVVHATLERHGIGRTEITCASPLLLCSMVVGTDRIAIVMRRLALAQSKYLPIRLLQPPIELGSLSVALQWHHSREMDGGMTWFRKAIVRALESHGHLDA